MTVPALLIQPRDTRWFWGWSPPPLGYMYLAASAPGTVIADCAQTGEAETAAMDRLRPEVVGVSCFSSTRHAALEVLREAKARGAITVLGGPHVSIRPMAELTISRYPWVDHVVMGDGEQAWAAIVAGEGMPRVIRGFVDDLDSLPPPDWSAVPVMDYPPRDEGIHDGVDLTRTPRISVVFSRGCPGRCTFCAAWRRPFRQHSPAYIRRMLEPLAALGVRHLCLDDDCWGVSPSSAIETAEILHGLNFVWSAETRADLLTPDLARHMRACGCYRVSVGVEHGSARLREVMHKPLPLPVLLAARNAAWNAGMSFHALILEGYPGETAADRAAAARTMQLLRPDVVSALGRTLVLPGTDLYATAIDGGALTHDIWLGPGRHLVAQADGGPPQMEG